GYIELEPRRGARVAAISAERASKLFEVREALEGLVAELAAQRRSAEQVTELDAVVRRGIAAADSGDHSVLPALNTEFHRLLSQAAHNELLSEIVERIAHLIQWAYVRRITQRSERSWAEHAEIAAAVASGDSDAAFARASTHIAHARDAFLHDEESRVLPPAQ
ncbi:MAG: GntR family transcriptional regulator, partial [Ilumatobacteraceae bacterium]